MFQWRQSALNLLLSLIMDDRTDSGMQMMLSAMAPPIDDDIAWQFADEHGIGKDEVLDSAAQSPSSSLFDDFDDSSSSSLSSPSFKCDSGSSSLSSFDMMMNMFPDPTTTMSNDRIAPVRKNVVVRKRARECSMVCWLFRTLLTSEYRALPLNAIYEIFEDTLQNQSTGNGRYYRQSIRQTLMTSAVFVRVLTPNPRKDFLVMNEQGSWWTVHPDCEIACAEQVFRQGAAHRCPPIASIPAYFSRIRMEEAKMAKTSSGGFSSAGSDCASSSSSSSSPSQSPTFSNASSSSSSSSQPSTSTAAIARRFDPLRRVAYGNTTASLRGHSLSGGGSMGYRRYTNSPAQSQKMYSTPSYSTAPSTSSSSSSTPLLNPRSILLNDIIIDHEEVII